MLPFIFGCWKLNTNHEHNWIFSFLNEIHISMSFSSKALKTIRTDNLNVAQKTWFRISHLYQYSEFRQQNKMDTIPINEHNTNAVCEFDSRTQGKQLAVVISIFSSFTSIYYLTNAIALFKMFKITRIH